MEKEIKVTIKTLDHEDLVNLMSTALEGGISYWCTDIDYELGSYHAGREKCKAFMDDDSICREDVYAEILLDNKPIQVYYCDDEAEENEVEDDLTVDKIKHGIELAIQDKYWDGDDWGDVDAVVADAIIQYALFDEIVFG